jgi:hypothetical protein
MAKVRNDYTIRKNRQHQRMQEDLWDVIGGGRIMITTQGKENAQEVANRLNKDPYALDFESYRSKKTKVQE